MHVKLSSSLDKEQKLALPYCKSAKLPLTVRTVRRVNNELQI
jgi:hypothetical protein